MKVLSIANRGIGKPWRQPEPTIFDLAALGPGLIAVTGVNGAGKSFLLESLPAALYQELPYRAPRSVYEYASGRDAVAEAVLEDAGRTIRVTARFDAERRKCERSLSIDGVSVANGKAAFDAKVRELFGSYESFLATVLSSQSKRGNLCEVPVVQRKALFAEFLGPVRYGVIHLRAKDRRERAEGQVNDLRRQIAAAEVELQAMPDAEIAVSVKEALAEAATINLDGAREEEAEASRKLGLAKSAAERITPLEAALAAAKRELDSAVKALAEAEALPEKARKALEGKLRFIAQGKAHELEGKARARHAAAVERIALRRTALESQLAEVPDLDRATCRLSEVTAELEGIAAEEREYEEEIRAEKRAADACVLADKALAAAGQARERERERLSRQAGLVLEVPCGRAAPHGWIRQHDSPGATTWEDIKALTVDLAGECILLADARKAHERLTELDGTLAEQAALDEARATLDGASQAASTAGKLLPLRDARRANLNAEDRALRDAIARARAAVDARKQLAGLATEIEATDKILSADMEEAGRAVAEAEEARWTAEAEYDKEVISAKSAVAEAEATRSNANGRKLQAEDALEEARAQLGDTGVADAQVALTRSTHARKTAESALREADQAVAAARAKLDALREREASIAPARERLTAGEIDLGDWRLLEEAMGKDGIPQLRIDAAGPEVSALATEILRVSWGTRFSIAIETTRELVTREGTAEAFEIVVWDGGERRTVEDLSGGERVVIHIAISLACAIYNRRKSGIDWRTLMIDEMDGALDRQHAQHYVPMLRRARELGEFHQILYVSHRPSVIEAADVVVTVEDGRLTVGGQREAA